MVGSFIGRVFGLAKSESAKDTYILFAGNLVSAFFGFVFTLITARALSVEDFGILSAITNLIIIISSFTDLGISSGLVNFVARAFGRGDETKVREYSKASFIMRLLALLPIILLLFVFAKFVSIKWLATSDPSASYWVGLISLVGIFWVFLPNILQAKKKFLQSISIDISFSFLKAAITYLVFLAGLLTVNTTLAAFAFSAAVAGGFGLWFVGTKFLWAKPSKKIYQDLINFSSLIVVN